MFKTHRERISIMRSPGTKQIAVWVTNTTTSVKHTKTTQINYYINSHPSFTFRKPIKLSYSFIKVRVLKTMESFEKVEVMEVDQTEVEDRTLAALVPPMSDQEFDRLIAQELEEPNT